MISIFIIKERNQNSKKIFVFLGAAYSENTEIVNIRKTLARIKKTGRTKAVREEALPADEAGAFQSFL